MNSGRFILRHLAFTGTGVPIARLDFSERMTFIYGASNTGKSFALAALDFMLGGTAKELPANPQRGPYGTAWLGLATPSGRSVTLSRALKGGPFSLQEGLHVARVEGAEVEVLQEKHDAKRDNTLSHMLLSELGLLGRRIAKNKSGEADNFTFRQLAPFVLVDETAIQAPRSPVVSGQRDDPKEQAVFRLLLTGRDDSDIVAVMTSPRFQVSKTAKIETIEDLMAGLDREIAASIASFGGATPDTAAVDDRLAMVRESWERAQNSVRRFLDLKRALRVRRSALDSRRDDIRVHMQRFTQLDQVYASDMARLEALEEAGFLLSLGADRDCPLCGATPEVQKKHHGTDDIGRQRAAALAEIKKIDQLRADLRTTVASLEIEHSILAGQLDSANRELEAVEADIERASGPAAENEAAMGALLAQRDAISRHRYLVDQLRGLEQKRAEFGKLKQSRKDQPLLKAPDAVLHRFCLIMSEVLRAWKFPGECQVSFDETQYDVKIDGKARRSNGKGVRALTHAAFKVALLLHCRQEGLPHPGFLVLDSPLVAYRDPVKSKKGGALEDDEKVIATSSVREHFFQHLASLSSVTQFVVLDNIDPPADVELHANVELFTGNVDQGRYGYFPANV